jgi:hypothetical protein
MLRPLAAAIGETAATTCVSSLSRLLQLSQPNPLGKLCVAFERGQFGAVNASISSNDNRNLPNDWRGSPAAIRSMIFLAACLAASFFIKRARAACRPPW